MTTFLPALIAALVLGLAIVFFVRRSRPTPTDAAEPGLSPTIHRVRANVRAILSAEYPATIVSSYGGTEHDLRPFTVTITTTTDRERDLIRTGKVLRERLRQALVNADYPVAAIPRVVFEIESQQSVAREETRNQARR